MTTTFDPAILTEATGVDTALAANILTVFLDNAPDYIDDAARAVGTPDWCAAVHKLTGAARGIGAAKLAELAAQFEQHAPASTAARARAALALSGELDALRRAVCSLYRIE